MSFKQKQKAFCVITLISACMLYVFVVYTHQSSVSVQYWIALNNGVRETVHHIQEQITNISALHHQDPTKVTVPLKAAIKKYDVLINSYMNCGSRFTGQLFGFRKDAFYIYEPLWKFSVFDYFRPPDLVCSSTQGTVNCRKSTAEMLSKSSNKVRGRASSTALVRNLNRNLTLMNMLTDVLNSMYNCDFTNIDNLFVTNVHDNAELAGPAWKPYTMCIRSRKPKQTCLKQEEQRCKNASHKVTKVLRLTNSAYDSLLAHRPNLKLIHLFRNPFAIVNSRTESKGYPVKDFSANAAILCKKMEYDYQEGLVLLKKYPNRVKFVFYEDIKSDVDKHMDKLYEYLGMDSEHSVVKLYNKVKTNKGNSNTPTMAKTRVADNAHWWRSHMTFVRYQQVRDKCRQMMGFFNLTDFHDRNQLLNMSLPEMRLPQHLQF